MLINVTENQEDVNASQVIYAEDNVEFAEEVDLELDGFEPDNTDNNEYIPHRFSV